VTGVRDFVDVVERSKIREFYCRSVGPKLVRVLRFVGGNGTVLVRLSQNFGRSPLAHANAAETAFANRDKESAVRVGMQRVIRMHISAEHLDLVNLIINREIEMNRPWLHCAFPDSARKSNSIRSQCSETRAKNQVG